MDASIKTYRFAEFTLNPAKRMLFREKAEIQLRDKDFDILLLLIESVPKTCSPDEIIEVIWNGVAVENNSIEKAIVNIRSALGDNAKRPRFIKTVRAKGYLFIGDVSAFEEKTLIKSFTETEEIKSDKKEINSDESQRNIQLQNSSQNQNKVWRARTALYFSVLFLIGFSVFFWWKGNKIWARLNSEIIFADDFSSGEFDPNRWKIKGNTARVENGIAKIISAESDKGGRLESTLFSFDLNKAVTIDCRIKVSYSQNLRDKVYFNGYFGLLPKTALLPLADADIKNHYMFGIKYMNYDYESKYPNGEIDELRTEGFFLIRDNGTPNKKIDYRDGRISKRLEPVWNEWFEQKLVYEPFSGKMSYFINDDLKDVINVGDLLKVMEENKLRLEINPSGWWVNHSIEIDYIEISQ